MGNDNVLVHGTKETPVVVLNRLEMNNLLSIDMMKTLTSRLRALVEEGARAIVLTNNGEFFCSGGELGNFTQKTAMEIKEFGDAFIELHKTIYNLPVPVIAAIKGKAHGGGFSLFESCDLAVAGNNVTFAVPEINSGLAPMMALTGIKRGLSKKKGLEISLLGNVITAEEAYNLGLINSVCDPEEVEERALKIAIKISNSNPTAIILCKQLYNSLDGLTYERQLNEGLAYLVSLLKSGDGEIAYQVKTQGITPNWLNK